MTADSLLMSGVFLTGIGLLGEQYRMTTSQIIEVVTTAGFGGIVVFLLVWFIPDVIKRHDPAERRRQIVFGFSPKLSRKCDANGGLKCK